MNKNIGEFLQAARKTQGLTQKELAEKINVSDKTISKWETGASMPDTSILADLCKVLEISVNELVSGKSISKEEYNQKAEENMISLLKQNQENMRASIFDRVLGIILIITAFIVTFYSMVRADLRWYIDLPTIILLACFCLGVFFVSRKRDLKNRIHIMRKAITPACMVILATSLIAALGNIGNYEALGPNLAVCLLSILYTAIIYFVLLMVEQYLS